MFKKEKGLGFGLILIFSLLLLASAYALEYLRGLEPCVLCLLQRYVLWMIALVAGLAWLQNPDRLGKQIYSFTLFLLNSVGILLATRHLWIQYQTKTETIEPCTAQLETLFTFKPLFSVLTEVLQNTHDCQVIHKLLGVPLSAWSMMGFIGILTLVLWTWNSASKRS